MESARGIFDFYSKFNDPRMDRFMMMTPLQPFTVIILYLVFIYKIGPKFMAKREPFSLRKVIILYNTSQIILNAIVFIMFFKVAHHLNVMCTPPAENVVTPTISLMLLAHYSYALLKFYDLTETIFFVLRKKKKQISYLHVHHHIGMIVASWISCRYFPGGQALFVGLYNSFVHVIMYCYYLLTSLDRNYTKNLWWKKYITILQIAQHYMIFFSVFLSVINVNCSYPKFWMGLFSINVLLIIYLFTKFYRENYMIKDKNK